MSRKKHFPAATLLDPASFVRRHFVYRAHLAIQLLLQCTKSGVPLFLMIRRGPGKRERSSWQGGRAIVQKSGKKSSSVVAAFSLMGKGRRRGCSRVCSALLQLSEERGGGRGRQRICSHLSPSPPPPPLLHTCLDDGAFAGALRLRLEEEKNCCA